MDVYINVIYIGLILFVPLRVLSSGLFWATGSFNYAWGVTGCLMFFIMHQPKMPASLVKKD